MLTFGALLICAAMLALPQAALVFRSPTPPRWTRWVWAEETVATLIVCAFIFGAGALIAGAYAASAGQLSFIDVALASILVALFVWIRRRLDLRPRLRALEAQGASATASPASRGRAAPATVSATVGDPGEPPQPHGPSPQAA